MFAREDEQIRWKGGGWNDKAFDHLPGVADSSPVRTGGEGNWSGVKGPTRAHAASTPSSVQGNGLLARMLATEL